MRKFLINVNGTSYEVEVEEVGGAAPVAAPAPAAAPAAAPKAAPAPAAVPAGGKKINAPMPGTVVDVKVNAGDTVKKGQILVILEAMKMENEIMAPEDGKVVSVVTTKGAAVNTGDALVVLG